MKPLTLALLLSTAAAPLGAARAATIQITITGTIAPYTWDGNHYTATPLVDVTGVFGTPGENLFGDPFSALWTVDTTTRIGSATLTINSGSVTYEPHLVTWSTFGSGRYINTTITPGVLAMNSFEDGTNLPNHLTGSFRHSGVWGYLNVSGPFVVTVPGPTAGSLGSLIALLKKMRSSKNVY